jgi:hypothetical protein
MIGELYPGEFEAMEHNGRMDALQQESCEDWCDVPSDEMTLEQARQAVKDLRKKLTEYLEQEPCDVFDKYGNYKYPSDVELTEPNTATSMPCEDAISREPFIDSTICEGISCNECSFNRKDKGGCILEERVMRLPSIQPQPKTGHWMTKPHIYGVAFCSECDELRIDKTKFCPNCGAKMSEIPTGSESEE